MLTIRQASADEAVPISKVLARAFADDPLELWCLTCDDYLPVLELELLEVIEQISPNGWLWVTDDLQGAVAWLPPGIAYDEAASEAVVNPVLAGLGGDADRHEGFWEWADSKRPATPHWYVDLLAVDPGHQKSGYGTALLEHGLSVVDNHHESAFLLTANPSVVPWYERYGFRTVLKETAPGSGPAVWFMLRSPVSN